MPACCMLAPVLTSSMACHACRVSRAAAAASSAVAASLSHLLTSQFQVGPLTASTLQHCSSTGFMKASSLHMPPPMNTQDGDLEQLLRSAVPLAGVAGSAGLQEAKDYLRQVIPDLAGTHCQAAGK